MSNFFEGGGPGYIVSNATSACEYCAYKVGDQFYSGLGFSFDNRWRDLGILAAFVGSNLCLLFLGVSSPLPVTRGFANKVCSRDTLILIEDRWEMEGKERDRSDLDCLVAFGGILKMD